MILRRRKVNIKKIKEIDGFSKYKEGYVELSAIGGALTIISVILSLWLIYTEVNYWLSSHFIFKLNVDDDLHATLPINIDITVAMPCDRLGADILDSTNQNVFNFGFLEEENTYFELTPEQRRQFNSMSHLNTYLREEYHAVQELLWRTNQLAMSFNPANKREENRNAPYDACRFHGSLTLNKVAGNFHITAGKSLILPRGHIHINTFFRDDINNFTHRINKLSFGDPSPGILHPLEGDEKVTNESAMLYQYFIEVVPTTVHTFLRTYNTYQYSVKEHRRIVDHDKGNHGLPGIFFKYDISPLKVNVKQERDNIFTFIVGLFATVGGIHAIGDVKQFECDECGKKFKLKQHLKGHKLTHIHALASYDCPKCDKKCKTGSGLQKHLQFHEKSEPFCEICDKKFNTLQALKAHHKSVHEKSTQVICDKCGKYFTNKYLLNNHIQIHLPPTDPLFTCDECPKKFRNDQLLKKHKKVHLGVRPHLCKVCGKAFSRAFSLKLHSYIHENALPYKCTSCIKAFRTNGLLKIHMRQHTGEKPFSCLECNHHFTNNSNFMKHLRGRHGLKKISLINNHQYPFKNNENKND